MNEDIITLRSLNAKTSSSDFIREMAGFPAERLTELEVGASAGAAHGEKSVGCLAQLGGCR